MICRIEALEKFMLRARYLHPSFLKGGWVNERNVGLLTCKKFRDGQNLNLWISKLFRYATLLCLLQASMISAAKQQPIVKESLQFASKYGTFVLRDVTLEDLKLSVNSSTWLRDCR